MEAGARMHGNYPGLYSAFCAKDPRFDGRFFVGVSSTRIYCRPVCRARTPKEENCAFFSSAAEAEQADYRPCLLCRPELAPGMSIADASASLAKRAARMIEENCGSGERLEQFAHRLHCTGRHLRRVFEEEFHVSPVQYLQTCRLLLAKNLLTDTKLRVVDIAMAAGFGSLRRFNDAFKEKYHLTPGDIRKRMSTTKREDAELKVSLGYRPPYRWKEMLRFLKGRAIAGIDLVRGDAYYRTVCLANTRRMPVTGWIAVSNNEAEHILEVSLSESLLSVLPQLLGKVRNMFDLYCDPEAVFESLSSMNAIRENLCMKGTRLPGCFDSFEVSVRAILGQQVTVKAAGTLAERLVSRFGIPVATVVEGLSRIFPPPEYFAGLDGPLEQRLGPLGITASRAGAIEALAKALARREICLDGCSDPEQETRKLMGIRGIGTWTANYIAMRAMAWPDAFLETDAGIRHALPRYSPRELRIMAEQWRPWRSYAAVNLWNSLHATDDNG